MRTPLSLVFYLSFAAPLAAQSASQSDAAIAFPAFTTEQNWARVSSLWNSSGVAAIAYAKSRGQTAEDYGRWLAAFFAPGWGPPSSGSAIRYARGIQNNLRSLVGTRIEVVTVHDTAVTIRASRSYAPLFTGPENRYLGVSLDEFELVGKLFNEEVGRHLGLLYHQRLDSAWVTMTITGRGTGAVLTFPHAAYASTFTPDDVAANPELAGQFESTYSPEGRFTLRRNGEVLIEGSYALSFDEITFRNERGPTACSNSGRYRWTVNTVTGNMFFGRLADDCDARFRYLTRRSFAKK